MTSYHLCSRVSLALVAMLVCLNGSDIAHGEFKVTQTDKEVKVELDGKPFTTYHIKSGAKPIFFPLLGPSGKELTRGYPMRPATETERNDHIHHRSFWFTHGDVNGISFWHENGKHGEIVHREFLKVEGGSAATIATMNDWVGPEGKKLCSDERHFTFGGDDSKRWIDAKIIVRAEYGDVKFGDTKEGCFGVRTAGTMKVDSKKGGKIVNSRGDKDKAAWGKAAEWVDYYGPVEGEVVGIAILNHPSSFRFPTHWHVRTYGLFAANPFGLRYFQGKQANGTHEMKKGDEFTLRYRVILHSGTTEDAKIAEAYKEYAGDK